MYKENNMIKGLIFDMDGLILDTEKLYNIFWKAACSDFGYCLDDSAALSLRSLSGENAKKRFLDLFGEEFDYKAVRAHRIELMDKYIEQNGVDIKPGAKELLSYAKQKGYKTSTATTSPLARTKSVLKLSGLDIYFDELVCGDMVKYSKPAPDIYLLAAKKLELDVSECLGFEDSPNGVNAIANAGMKAVMIPDLSEPDDNVRNMLFALRKNLFEAMDLL